jgi:predicted transcriptional regulator
MSEQQKSVVITVRLPETLVQAIDKIAKGKDRSRNYIVAKLLSDNVWKQKAAK